MESQKMTQQDFASFIDVSPATLSSIYTGRTRPTINMVEAIKKKIPELSTDWLMFGSGDMYVGSTPLQEQQEGGGAEFENAARYGGNGMEMTLDFDNGGDDGTLAFGQPHRNAPQNQASARNSYNGVRNTPNNRQIEIQKNINKIQRNITEIRIYFDDQTYETFTPSKK